jgi:hypothetical protein
MLARPAAAQLTHVCRPRPALRSSSTSPPSRRRSMAACRCASGPRHAPRPLHPAPPLARRPRRGGAAPPLRRPPARRRMVARGGRSPPAQGKRGRPRVACDHRRAARVGCRPAGRRCSRPWRCCAPRPPLRLGPRMAGRASTNLSGCGCRCLPCGCVVPRVRPLERAGRARASARAWPAGPAKPACTLAVLTCLLRRVSCLEATPCQHPRGPAARPRARAARRGRATRCHWSHSQQARLRLHQWPLALAWLIARSRRTPLHLLLALPPSAAVPPRRRLKLAARGPSAAAPPALGAAVGGEPGPHLRSSGMAAHVSRALARVTLTAGCVEFT